MKKFFSTHTFFRIMAVVYIVAAMAASTQSMLLKRSPRPGDKAVYTKYNNYVIFRQSFFHLLDGKNLYTEYPEEQQDLYKYSPTFALMFGALACLPDWLGLPLWNLLNVLVFLFAVWLLPEPAPGRKGLLLLLAAVDVLTSLQNSQSNVLVAGLLILGFALYEKNRLFAAVLCIMLTFYIKLFGIAVLLLFLLRPGRTRVLLYTAAAFLLLGLLPAPFTGFRGLMTVYLQYADMLKADQSVSYGLSVMGWLRTWFGLEPPKMAVVLGGTLILCLPLLNFRRFGLYAFRAGFLAALMAWMILFNHKAESPGFIIATAGIFIWLLSSRLTLADRIIAGLVIVFTSLSNTDLFPRFIRDNYFAPWVVKVVPCIIAWIKILYDLAFMRAEEVTSERS